MLKPNNLNSMKYFRKNGFSLFPSGQLSPVSAALNNIVFVRAVALCAGITARVWVLHVACLSRYLVARHSLCSCSILMADFEGL